MSAPFRFPDESHRTFIFGKTGSGKTQFAAFLLSRAPFHRQPYIIVDYKHDELLNSCDRIKEIGLKDKLPKQNGLYIVHPLPGRDDAAVEEWLWRVWQHERVGLFFDEATLIPGSAAGSRGYALQALLQQGRSKRTPVMAITQRPSGVSRQLITEASFIAGFYINTKPDLERVRDMMPVGAMDGLAMDYHCRWWDDQRNRLTRFTPAPDADTIRNVLYDRLAPKRRSL